MAVTFGCPLVGTYDELCGKHLKVGQRAYATDGNSISTGKEDGKSYTNWKTGAVDDKGNLIAYENLDWDTNMGGDNENINLSNYYTKEEIDDKLEDEIFTFTCDIIENPEGNGEVEIKNLSAAYEEVLAAYEKEKTIKAIANLSDRNWLMLNLAGFTDEGFYFSNVGGNFTLVLFLGNDIVLAFITYLQYVDNMLQKIEGNENIDDYYPSVKAVADYVAKYGGGDVVIPIISWDEANELLSTGIYRVDNASILISSLLEQQARQVLITGDEFSSRHKTKNIETNEWNDWSEWNYFITSEDFQNAINFVNETLANYYTKEEVDEKDNELQQGVDFVLGQIANFQFDLNLKENLSNKTNTISDMPSIDKYPSESAVFDYGQSLINSCNSFTASYVAQEIGNIETALENIIEKYGLGGDAS